MNSFIIEIRPKKPEFDPLARSVRSELLEGDGEPSVAQVRTERLYKISGDLTLEQMESITSTLLVDPVIEVAKIEEGKKVLPKKKKSKAKEIGFVLDVWPKAGVTDPVGETVEKGLRDLNFQGPLHAASAQRYIFPKMKNLKKIVNLAKQSLANELIHDIYIRKFN